MEGGSKEIFGEQKCRLWKRHLIVTEYVSPHFQVHFIVKWSHVAKGLEEVTSVIFDPKHLKVIQSLSFSQQTKNTSVEMSASPLDCVLK